MKSNEEYFSMKKLLLDITLKIFCIKASKKLQALLCEAPYMKLTKRKFLMNTFSDSQFGYCPFAWMCNSYALNNKINRLHERCIRLLQNDKQLTFEELLEKNGSVSIHARNMQTLAIQLYNVVNDGSPKIMMEIFRICEESGYNLRHQNTFKRPIANSVYSGTDMFRFWGLKFGNLFLQKLKNWFR